jgi:hypothetical protein
MRQSITLAIEEFDEMKTRIEWQRRGTDAIEKCLAVSAKGDWNDAPMPLHGDDARLWLRAQTEAYQHALEMMGYLSDESPSSLQTPIAKEEGKRDGIH